MKNNNRKAQAAIEFLMTYGWALVAVLGSIAILTWLGVFDISVYLPDKCVGAIGIECSDFDTVNTDGEVLFQIQNALGQEIFLVDGSTISESKACVLSDVKAANGDAVPAQSLSDVNITVPNSEYASIMLSCGPVSQGRFRLNYNMVYLNAQTGNYHNAVFTIKGRVRD